METKRFNKKEAEAITLNVTQNYHSKDLEDLVDRSIKELYEAFGATKATVTFINYDMRAVIHNELSRKYKG